MTSFVAIVLALLQASSAFGWTTTTGSPSTNSNFARTYCPRALCNALSDNNNGDDDSHYISRRKVMQQVALASLASFIPSNQLPTAEAAMTDETTSLAEASTDASYRQQSPTSSIGAITQTTKVPALSDEMTLVIFRSDLQNMKGGLGLELGEVSFRTNFRVIVKSVVPDSLAARLGIKPGYVVVAVNDQATERTDAPGVGTYFQRAVKQVLNMPDFVPDEDASMTLTFRDPSKFRSDLENLPEGGSVSTKVAPGGDTTQRNSDGSLRPNASVTDQDDQIITISQLIPPRMCNRRATTDDLLEISYIGQVVETGAIFDGSAVKINGEGIPGRGNDISVFFVLGKQPFGQFPPGWDVGLDGMCVGERRRLVIPPVLAYGATGVPRRGIPPNATLQYDVTLVSMNGLATPQ